MQAGADAMKKPAADSNGYEQGQAYTDHVCLPILRVKQPRCNKCTCPHFKHCRGPDLEAAEEKGELVVGDFKIVPAEGPWLDMVRFWLRLPLTVRAVIGDVVLPVLFSSSLLI